MTKKNLLIGLSVLLICTGAYADKEVNSGDTTVNSDVTVQSPSVATNIKANHKHSAASSASDLILTTCQSGFSVQTHMGGGNLGSPDEVCLLFQLAQIRFAEGEFEAGDRALDKAESILKWRANPVIRFFQAIPVVRRIF